MAAVSDVAALDMPVRPIDVENPAPPTTLLDGLSVDILTKIASSLDYRSLFNLERVSEKCQHAVVLHFGRKSSFTLVSGSFQDNDSEWKRLRPEQKVTLLSRLTGLRELDLTLFERRAGQQLLNWMVTASTGWLQLEKLTLELYINGKLDPTLVGQLCSNCTRLTDVTLKYGAMTDAMVKAVLTARHGELRRLWLGCAKTKFKAKSRARLAAGLAAVPVWSRWVCATWTQWLIVCRRAVFPRCATSAWWNSLSQTPSWPAWWSVSPASSLSPWCSAMETT